MLNVGKLKDNIQDALEQTIPPAIETCINNKFPATSERCKKEAEEFAETFKELVCPQLADLLANAIDYYVKNISITGTIITVGSPVTQSASVVSMPMPTMNGKIPNTLGIS